MTGKCVNNGARPKWTDQDMIDAMIRVQALAGFCGVNEYRQHCQRTDPTSGAIVSRFRKWNLAKIQAGLPIQVKMVRDGEKLGMDEVELERQKRTKYPCWRCKRPFMGLGRRKGQWHCEECTTAINLQAAGMGW